MRARPKFNQWACELVVDYLPSMLSEDQVRTAITTAGAFVGLCDWRPKYGRFEVKE